MSPLAEFAWYVSHPRPGDIQKAALTLVCIVGFGLMAWLGLLG